MPRPEAFVEGQGYRGLSSKSFGRASANASDALEMSTAKTEASGKLAAKWHAQRPVPQPATSTCRPALPASWISLHGLDGNSLWEVDPKGGSPMARQKLRQPAFRTEHKTPSRLGMWL